MVVASLFLARLATRQISPWSHSWILRRGMEESYRKGREGERKGVEAVERNGNR